MSWLSFSAFVSECVKAAHKHVNEIEPWLPQDDSDWSNDDKKLTNYQPAVHDNKILESS